MVGQGIGKLTRDTRIAVALSLAAAMIFALGAPLSRVAKPITAAEVTFWRLVLAMLVALVVVVVSRVPIANICSPRMLVLGATLYAHFLLFTLAAQTTTTAHTLALVYTSPVLVALGSALVLREPPCFRQIIGVIVVVVGVAVLVGFEPTATGATLAGDLAAVGSGSALAAYVLASRYYRRTMPLAAYVFSVYGWAAIWALPWAAVVFDGEVYTGDRITAIILLGVVSLGIGHTLLNAALRRARATIPNVITTQEVTGGVVLGALMYGDIPGWTTLLGALVALAGVIMVITFASRNGRTEVVA